MIPAEAVLRRLRLETAAREEADKSSQALILEANVGLSDALAKIRAQTSEVRKIQNDFSSSVGDVSAKVHYLESVRISDQAAIIDRVDSLSVSISDAAGVAARAQAAIDQYKTAAVSTGIAIAQQIDSLRSSVGDNSATIQTIQTTMVTPSTVAATVSSSVSASLATALGVGGSITVAIASETSARLTSETAIGSRIDSIIAGGTGNAVFVSNTTPASTHEGDTWFNPSAGYVCKVYHGGAWVDTTNTNLATSASVTTLASATTTSIGNLTGRYGLYVTAGNVITGMEITSSTGAPGSSPISDVIFNAGNFKVSDGSTSYAPFQVTGGHVRITGSLVLSPSDVGGLGALATLSAVDLTTTQVTNKSLANLDGTASTKLAGIAAGATVGATWGSNIVGQPTNLAGLDATANAKLVGISAGADVTLAAINGQLAVTGGGLVLSSSAMIRAGQTGYDAGTGFFLGMSGGTPKFSLGVAGGQGMKWDGSNLTINGSLTLTNTIPAGNVSGLAGVATSGTLAAGSVTGLAATALSSDFSAVTGATKPADNADVTLSKLNGGLTVTGGGITLSSGGAIKGGSSDYLTGTGFFLGYSGGQYKFSVGNPAGYYISWDGSTWTVNVPVAPSISSSQGFGTAVSTTYVDVVSVAPALSAGPHQISLDLDTVNNDAALRTATLNLYRDGVSIWSSAFNLTANQEIFGTKIVTDSPGAGTHTYLLRIRCAGSGQSISETATMTII